MVGVGDDSVQIALPASTGSAVLAIWLLPMLSPPAARQNVVVGHERLLRKLRPVAFGVWPVHDDDVVGVAEVRTPPTLSATRHSDEDGHATAMMNFHGNGIDVHEPLAGSVEANSVESPVLKLMLAARQVGVLPPAAQEGATVNPLGSDVVCQAAAPPLGFAEVTATPGAAPLSELVPAARQNGLAPWVRQATPASEYPVASPESSEVWSTDQSLVEVPPGLVELTSWAAVLPTQSVDVAHEIVPRLLGAA
jgi:hypothetical protein